MYRYTDKFVSKLNKCLETVTEITSATIDLSVEGDPLTTWDYERYEIVRYKDKPERRSLTSRKTPSIMLHKIKSILEGWGFEYNSSVGRNGEKLLFRCVECWMSIELNTFHLDMIKLNDSKDWIDYHEQFIEKWINEYIIEHFKDDKNIKREILIRGITNVEL